MIIDFLIHTAHAAEEAQSSGVAGTLGLNAKLFIAQLVNFGIVLFVLWKWVFTPVTKALQARTESIEKSLEDAETVAQERIHFDEWKQQEMAKIRNEAGGIIAAAKSEADALKASMLIETKHEQDLVLEKTRKQLEAEQIKAVSAVKEELAEIVTQAAEKTIREKLTTTKDKEMIKLALSEALK